MQASLPGLVDAVKIADFTIGKNALRIISVRALPDHPQDKDYPRDEWIDQGNKKARGEKEALDEATSEEVRPSLDRSTITNAAIDCSKAVTMSTLRSRSRTWLLLELKRSTAR